jgi:hypothetical protein
MKVYVLGLEDGFRGAELRDFLVRSQFDTKIVFGIHGSNLPPDVLASVYSRRRSARIMKRELTPEEVACVIGHRRIYQEFAQTGEEWALILEEDSVPAGDFLLDQVQLKNFSEPMIVCLQGVASLLSQFSQFPHLVHGVTELSANDKSLSVYSVKGNIQGAYAYLMNRQAALIALNSYRTIDSAADWPYAWRSKIAFHLTDHSQFGVRLEGSLIDQGRAEKLRLADFQLKNTGIHTFVNRFTTIFGLIGFFSTISFFQGYGFRQDYRERFVVPFLIRRFQNGRRWL